MYVCAYARPFAPSKRGEFSLFNETASAIGVKSVREGHCDLSCYEKMVFSSVEISQSGERVVDGILSV